jgi:flagellar motor switch protein FliN/FliY
MAKAAQGVMEKPDVKQEASQSEAQKQAQSVEFEEAVGSDAAGNGASLDILLDMNVPITVTIGQTEIQVRRLLQLGPGSVVKLDKSIEEPMDLYLKDVKFATGTAVVVDGRFAIKITQILGLGNSAGNTAKQ